MRKTNPRREDFGDGFGQGVIDVVAILLASAIAYIIVSQVLFMGWSG